MTPELKIAFISDLHFSRIPIQACPKRKGHCVEQLLDKLIPILNEEVKPDLFLCGGDLINDADAEDAGELLQILSGKLDLLSMPKTVIRGNHDPRQEIFTKYFPFREVTDLDFLRIVSFDDEEAPFYNAVRSEKDRKRMVASSREWDGVCFSFQHTPLTGPGECIFGYQNAEDLLTDLERSSCNGTLSGHYHNGIDLYRKESLQIFVQRAFCEPPFSCSILHVDQTGIVSVDQVNIQISR